MGDDRNTRYGKNFHEVGKVAYFAKAATNMKTIDKAGGIVIHERTGMVAVVTNEFGLQVLPKGSLEPGESFEEAARREIHEETGLQQLTFIRSLGVLKRPGHISAASASVDTIKHIHMYLYATTENVLKPVLPDSVTADWVPPDTLARTLSWPEEYAFLEEACPELFAK